MTLRIVLLVDAIMGMVRKNRCVLVLIHRAFHNDEGTQRMRRKHSPDHNASASILDRSGNAGCLFSEVSRRIRQRPSIQWSIKYDSSENDTCRYSVNVQLR
ncbi:hypothetical protein TNCV_3270531 [Trichonephila clavipes]|nr:hypothetical protein TNCV_3270531 [Trichonephila clavipes]